MGVRQTYISMQTSTIQNVVLSCWDLLNQTKGRVLLSECLGKLNATHILRAMNASII